MRVTEQSSFRRPDAQRLADQGNGAPASSPRRLPSVRRERKPALAALALLLIAGGALLTAYLVIQMGGRVSAIQVKAAVGAGQQIPAAALEEIQIASDTQVSYLPWTDAGEATRRYAKVDLVPGTLLIADMTTVESNGLAPGKAIVGLSLKDGQVPAAIGEGSRVQVIYVPGDDGAVDAGRVLADRAVVKSLSSSQASGTTLVDVVIDKGVAATVSAYASAGRIALAYLPAGKNEPPAPAVSTTPSPAVPTTTPTRRPTATPKPTGSG